MFNLQGSEIIFILLIALVVLGPEKLPGAIRRVTTLYAELRKMSSGFQEEFKSALDEPIREMKSTADLMKSAADPKRMAEEAEREAEMEAAAERKARQASDNVAKMEAAGAAHMLALSAEDTDDEPGAGAFDDPVDTSDPDQGEFDDFETDDFETDDFEADDDLKSDVESAAAGASGPGVVAPPGDHASDAMDDVDDVEKSA